jgi:hypothetical protein
MAVLLMHNTSFQNAILKEMALLKNSKRSEIWLDRAARNGNLKAKAKTGDIGYFIGLAAKKIKEESAPIIDSIKQGFNHTE